MTALARFRLVTTGYTGAPGYNVLHFSQGTEIGGWDQASVDDTADELKTLIESLPSFLVDDATISLDPEVTIFDDDTGNATNAFTITDPGTGVGGTGTGVNLSRGSCALIAFSTDVWTEGRRLRGRMFLGPISAACFENDGDIDSGARDDLAGYFTAITSGIGTRLAVWHRPTGPSASDGYYGDVVNTSVRARPSYLRSRVD